MRTTLILAVLFTAALEAAAADVRFRDTFTVTDKRTGQSSAFTRVENDSGRDQDVFVTRNGVRRKVGTLKPGGRGSVTVIPVGDGLYLWNEESSGD